MRLRAADLSAAESWNGFELERVGVVGLEDLEEGEVGVPFSLVGEGGGWRRWRSLVRLWRARRKRIRAMMARNPTVPTTMPTMAGVLSLIDVPLLLLTLVFEFAFSGEAVWVVPVAAAIDDAGCDSETKVEELSVAIAAVNGFENSVPATS